MERRTGMKEHAWNELLAEKPWASPAPLREQLYSSPPKGEGFLMRTPETAVLKGILLHIVETKESIPPSDKPLVQAALELSEQVHKDDKRRDQTPYVNHPIRIAIREAQAEGVTPMHLMIDLLHDAKEDHGISQQDITTYFHDRHAIPLETAEQTAEEIYFGIDALDKDPYEEKLSINEYHNRLNQAHLQRPQLHLWRKKYLDRKDNYLTDFIRAMNNEADDKAKQAIDDYEEKVALTVPFIAQHEPQELFSLKETLDLGERLKAA